MTEVAKPILRKRKWPSLIWLIPASCAVIAGLYARDYFANHGPELTIDFADASGLRVGEGKVLYRGAEIGRVNGIELNDSHKRALVHVQFDKHEEIFASKGATFWIVRPEVSENGLSGLGTLFSGPYIAAVPGNGETSVEEIEGLTKPPRQTESGERFVLTARRMGHVQEGAVVSYKSIQVGAVEKV
jgi:paraquat-inducible protein B